MPSTQPHPCSDSATRAIAPITLELHIGNRLIHPSQISFDQIILREPSDSLAGRARLVMQVGDVTHASEIEILPHQYGSLKIPIRLIG